MSSACVSPVSPQPLPPRPDLDVRDDGTAFAALANAAAAPAPMLSRASTPPPASSLPRAVEPAHTPRRGTDTESAQPAARSATRGVSQAAGSRDAAAATPDDDEADPASPIAADQAVAPSPALPVLLATPAAVPPTPTVSAIDPGETEITAATAKIGAAAPLTPQGASPALLAGDVAAAPGAPPTATGPTPEAGSANIASARVPLAAPDTPSQAPEAAFRGAAPAAPQDVAATGVSIASAKPQEGASVAAASPQDNAAVAAAKPQDVAQSGGGGAYRLAGDATQASEPARLQSAPSPGEAPVSAAVAVAPASRFGVAASPTPAPSQVSSAAKPAGAKAGSTSAQATAAQTATQAVGGVPTDAVQAATGPSTGGDASHGDAPADGAPSGQESPVGAIGSDGAPASAPSTLQAQPAASAAASQPAAAAVRAGASETVAGLAASMARRLDGRTSRFDVALNPLGLGRVDVRLEIGADGRASAALAFDRPEAAALLQAHSGELRQALAQSGLDLAPDALTFDVANGGAGGFSPGAQSGGDQAGRFAGSAAARSGAFAQASSALDAPPAAYAAAAARGLDIRI